MTGVQYTPEPYSKYLCCRGPYEILTALKTPHKTQTTPISTGVYIMSLPPLLLLRALRLSEGKEVVAMVHMQDLPGNLQVSLFFG